jgi:hypothetical protein
MMRTVWLAAFCLAGLGGLYASKVTASISSDGNGTAAATIDTGIVPDTLTAGDKIDPMRAPAATEATSMPTIIPIVLRQVKARRTIGLVRPRPPTVVTANAVAVLPKPRRKSKLARNPTAPRYAADQTKCVAADSLSALITSLTGAPRCG